MSSHPETGEDCAVASNENTDRLLRAVLRDVLALDEGRVAGFTSQSGLFGHLPELDSMAVASLLTELEDRFAIIIEDDEIDGEMLETYGALLAFIEAKQSR
ncbi:acyl carrier protein [Altericroceibacterium spongiae]|uniref:Acyl carrier protein n=1 Tax=Altericroceibacterium spongiae TaxID=2320269 RepID=A0A420ERB6_9SPHN|nr:phosphopantetheine-binding protein [Altericroceibacterium spongiae]RKF23234.1 acyl carrier protein [Altericroceibacterium spongiae]